jgi:hypothetical protein
MPSGDSLTVLLFLLGAAVAAAIGAITAPEGWRTQALWGFTFAFCLIAIGWVLAPAASPAMQAIEPLALALVESNFLAMTGIVGVVALMLDRDRRASNQMNDAQIDMFGTEAHQDLIYSLETAKREAEITTSTSNDANRTRNAERVLPEVRAALLSANRLYGIPLPPEPKKSSSVPLFLEVHRRLIEKILPFLKQGHLAEAHNQANALLSVFDDRATPIDAA